MRLGRWELRKRRPHDGVRVEMRLRTAEGTLLHVDLDALRLLALYGGFDSGWRDGLGLRADELVPMAFELRVL